MKLLSRKRDFEIPESGISTVERLNIGGIEQTILIQAQHTDKPVLLFLHGGPSMPLPGVSCRFRDYTVATTSKELIHHYVLVFWDQRGTGKSYHPGIPKESINLAQFISDAKELVDYLRERFVQDKIVIAGHSWGSVIGLSLATQIPDKLHAYIGISQIVDWPENDRLCREWVINEATKRGHSKAVDELTRLGEPPYTESYKQWGLLRKWLMRYNSMIYKNKEIKPPSLLDAMKIMLFSSDYTLKDIYNSLYKGFIFSFTQQMIEDFSRVNFFESAKNVDVPIFFIHGRKDVHVYGSLIQTYFDHLNALKSKHLYWVEKSSHMFHPDDAREIEKILIEQVGAVIDQFIRNKKSYGLQKLYRLKEGPYQSVGILEDMYVFEILTGITDTPEYYRITKEEFYSYDHWKNEWITDLKTLYTIVNRKCIASGYNRTNFTPRNYHFDVATCEICGHETVSEIGNIPLGTPYEVTCSECGKTFTKLKD